ncbi:hypothetical protein BDR26DRAFT_519611 [Obelidium mucronatum]|nr:hypothetical protein BDR26DRAFT_519611 [Obelidium mucronatum]
MAATSTANPAQPHAIANISEAPTLSAGSSVRPLANTRPTPPPSSLLPNAAPPERPNPKASLKRVNSVHFNGSALKAEPEPCSLPVMCPIHLYSNIPVNTLSRQAHDIQEAEALAKLAIELNSPLDITLQSTFERLVALAGSKEFLPVAAKVRHYLHSVASKRREWCVEFCIKPYVGPSGEGLFGRIGREGMVCGGTYIVPAAILRGMDFDHMARMDALKAKMADEDEAAAAAAAMQMNFSMPQLPQTSRPHSVFNANPVPYTTIHMPHETRPCCSVDTTVFDKLGVSNTYRRCPEYAYNSTPSWINPVYAAHQDNCYYKYRRDQHITRCHEQASQRIYQHQQRNLQQNAQYEMLYQTMKHGQFNPPAIGTFGGSKPTQTPQLNPQQQQLMLLQQQQQQMLMLLNSQSILDLETSSFQQQNQQNPKQQTQLQQPSITSTPKKKQKLDDSSVLFHATQLATHPQGPITGNNLSNPSSQLKYNTVPNHMPSTRPANNANSGDGLSRASSSSGLNGSLDSVDVDGNSIANVARAAEN